MNELNLETLNTKLAFGGLIENNAESIDLRKQQIIDNFRIHSCFHYNKALDVIKIASDELKIIPKMITKVYFNYNYKNRHNTILQQLFKIADKLKFVPREWHIQICVNPSFRDFKREEYVAFKKIVNENFGEVKYFIETEKLWERNTSKVVNSNFVDGSCFFLNGIFKSINKNHFINKPFITFGMLAGGHNHTKMYKEFYECKLSKKIKMGKLEIINRNILFFLKLTKNKNFKYSITSVKTKKNYKDLISQISDLNVSKNNFINGDLDLNELVDIFSFKHSDTYGLKYTKFYNKFLYNKRGAIHEILTLIPFIQYAKKWK